MPGSRKRHSGGGAGGSGRGGGGNKKSGPPSKTFTKAKGKDKRRHYPQPNGNSVSSEDLVHTDTSANSSPDVDRVEMRADGDLVPESPPAVAGFIADEDIEEDVDIVEDGDVPGTGTAHQALVAKVEDVTGQVMDALSEEQVLGEVTKSQVVDAVASAVLLGDESIDHGDPAFLLDERDDDVIQMSDDESLKDADSNDPDVAKAKGAEGGRGSHQSILHRDAPDVPIPRTRGRKKKHLKVASSDEGETDKRPPPPLSKEQLDTEIDSYMEKAKEPEQQEVVAMMVEAPADNGGEDGDQNPDDKKPKGDAPEEPEGEQLDDEESPEPAADANEPAQKSKSSRRRERRAKLVVGIFGRHAAASGASGGASSSTGASGHSCGENCSEHPRMPTELSQAPKKIRKLGAEAVNEYFARKLADKQRADQLDRQRQHQQQVVGPPTKKSKKQIVASVLKKLLPGGRKTEKGETSQEPPPASGGAGAYAVPRSRSVDPRPFVSPERGGRDGQASQRGGRGRGGNGRQPLAQFQPPPARQEHQSRPTQRDDSRPRSMHERVDSDFDNRRGRAPAEMTPAELRERVHKYAGWLPGREGERVQNQLRTADDGDDYDEHNSRRGRRRPSRGRRGRDSGRFDRDHPFGDKDRDDRSRSNRRRANNADQHEQNQAGTSRPEGEQVVPNRPDSVSAELELSMQCALNDALRTRRMRRSQFLHLGPEWVWYIRSRPSWFWRGWGLAPDITDDESESDFDSPGPSWQHQPPHLRTPSLPRHLERVRTMPKRPKQRGAPVDDSEDDQDDDIPVRPTGRGLVRSYAVTPPSRSRSDIREGRSRSSPPNPGSPSPPRQWAPIESDPNAPECMLAHNILHAGVQQIREHSFRTEVDFKSFHTRRTHRPLAPRSRTFANDMIEYVDQPCPLTACESPQRHFLDQTTLPAADQMLSLPLDDPLRQVLTFHSVQSQAIRVDDEMARTETNPPFPNFARIKIPEPSTFAPSIIPNPLGEAAEEQLHEEDENQPRVMVSDIRDRLAHNYDVASLSLNGTSPFAQADLKYAMGLNLPSSPSELTEHHAPLGCLPSEHSLDLVNDHDRAYPANYTESQRAAGERRMRWFFLNYLAKNTDSKFPGCTLREQRAFLARNARGHMHRTLSHQYFYNSTDVDTYIRHLCVLKEFAMRVMGSLTFVVDVIAHQFTHPPSMFLDDETKPRWAEFVADFKDRRIYVQDEATNRPAGTFTVCHQKLAMERLKDLLPNGLDRLNAWATGGLDPFANIPAEVSQGAHFDCGPSLYVLWKDAMAALSYQFPLNHPNRLEQVAGISVGVLGYPPLLLQTNRLAPREDESASSYVMDELGSLRRCLPAELCDLLQASDVFKLVWRRDTVARLLSNTYGFEEFGPKRGVTDVSKLYETLDRIFSHTQFPGQRDNPDLMHLFGIATGLMFGGWRPGISYETEMENEQSYAWAVDHFDQLVGDESRPGEWNEDQREYLSWRIHAIACVFHLHLACFPALLYRYGIGFDHSNQHEKDRLELVYGRARAKLMVPPRPWATNYHMYPKGRSPTALVSDGQQPKYDQVAEFERLWQALMDCGAKRAAYALKGFQDAVLGRDSSSPGGLDRIWPLQRELQVALLSGAAAQLRGQWGGLCQPQTGANVAAESASIGPYSDMVTSCGADEQNNAIAFLDVLLWKLSRRFPRLQVLRGEEYNPAGRYVSTELFLGAVLCKDLICTSIGMTSDCQLLLQVSEHAYLPPTYRQLRNNVKTCDDLDLRLVRTDNARRWVLNQEPFLIPTERYARGDALMVPLKCFKEHSQAAFDDYIDLRLKLLSFLRDPTNRTGDRFLRAATVLRHLRHFWSEHLIVGDERVWQRALQERDRGKILELIQNNATIDQLVEVLNERLTTLPEDTERPFMKRWLAVKENILAPSEELQQAFNARMEARVNWLREIGHNLPPFSSPAFGTLMLQARRTYADQLDTEIRNLNLAPEREEQDPLARHETEAKRERSPLLTFVPRPAGGSRLVPPESGATVLDQLADQRKLSYNYHLTVVNRRVKSRERYLFGSALKAQRVAISREFIDTLFTHSIQLLPPAATMDEVVVEAMVQMMARAEFVPASKSDTFNDRQVSRLRVDSESERDAPVDRATIYKHYLLAKDLYERSEKGELVSQRQLLASELNRARVPSPDLPGIDFESQAIGAPDANYHLDSPRSEYGGLSYNQFYVTEQQGPDEPPSEVESAIALMLAKYRQGQVPDVEAEARRLYDTPGAEVMTEGQAAAAMEHMLEWMVYASVGQRLMGVHDETVLSTDYVSPAIAIARARERGVLRTIVEHSCSLFGTTDRVFNLYETAKNHPHLKTRWLQVHIGTTRPVAQPEQSVADTYHVVVDPNHAHRLVTVRHVEIRLKDNNRYTPNAVFGPLTEADRRPNPLWTADVPREVRLLTPTCVELPEYVNVVLQLASTVDFRLGFPEYPHGPKDNPFYIVTPTQFFEPLPGYDLDRPMLPLRLKDCGFIRGPDHGEQAFLPELISELERANAIGDAESLIKAVVNAWPHKVTVEIEQQLCPLSVLIKCMAFGFKMLRAARRQAEYADTVLNGDTTGTFYRGQGLVPVLTEREGNLARLALLGAGRYFYSNAEEALAKQCNPRRDKYGRVWEEDRQAFGLAEDDGNQVVAEYYTDYAEFRRKHAYEDNLHPITSEPLRVLTKRPGELHGYYRDLKALRFPTSAVALYHWLQTRPEWEQSQFEPFVTLERPSLETEDLPGAITDQEFCYRRTIVQPNRCRLDPCPRGAALRTNAHPRRGMA